MRRQSVVDSRSPSDVRTAFGTVCAFVSMFAFVRLSGRIQTLILEPLEHGALSSAGLPYLRVLKM